MDLGRINLLEPTHRAEFRDWARQMPPTIQLIVPINKYAVVLGQHVLADVRGKVHFFPDWWKAGRYLLEMRIDSFLVKTL